MPRVIGVSLKPEVIYNRMVPESLRNTGSMMHRLLVYKSGTRETNLIVVVAPVFIFLPPSGCVHIRIGSKIIHPFNRGPELAQQQQQHSRGPTKNGDSEV